MSKTFYVNVDAGEVSPRSTEEFLRQGGSHKEDGGAFGEIVQHKGSDKRE
jgi:hypothetical protein